MFIFILRRLWAGLLTLFVVISLTFFMMRLMPGGPFDNERKLPAAIEKNLLARYKLDGTLWEQYSGYIRDVARGDLRLSTKYRNRSVNEIIGQTLPVSLTLGATAFLLALATGITLGSLAAVGHKTWVDRTSMLLAVLSISIPNFVIAPLAILFFALKWTILPVAGWDSPAHLVMPSICLALPFSAYIARLTRNSMLDVINQDYIRTARAKGLGEARVIVKHALKVALLPVVSFSGPLAANLLTGSLVIEEIFKVPGVGAFFVNGVLNRDLFMVGGVVILYSTLLIVFNLAVDVLYPFLDRRIQLT
ncbi:MAG: ABC transporter permease subunit [Verrucomicrobia bacterium]|nr:ABC transporter permease subunit [Verrucomicrobiota bacterium]